MDKNTSLIVTNLNLEHYFKNIDRDLLSLVMSNQVKPSRQWHQRAASKPWYKYTDGSRGYTDLWNVGDRALYVMVVYQLMRDPLADPGKRDAFINDLLNAKTLTALSKQLGICPRSHLHQCRYFLQSIIGALYIQYRNIPLLTEWFFNIEEVYSLYQAKHVWVSLEYLGWKIGRQITIPKKLQGKWGQIIEYINKSTDLLTLTVEPVSDMADMENMEVKKLVLRYGRCGQDRVYYEMLFITDYSDDFHGKEMVELLLKHGIIKFK